LLHRFDDAAIDLPASIIVVGCVAILIQVAGVIGIFAIDHLACVQQKATVCYVCVKEEKHLHICCVAVVAGWAWFVSKRVVCVKGRKENRLRRVTKEKTASRGCVDEKRGH
jgi:uncharacterized membrane protein YbjE (DUF340 family)